MKYRKVARKFFTGKMIIILGASVFALSTGCGKTDSPDVSTESGEEINPEASTGSDEETSTNAGDQISDDAASSFVATKIDDNSKPIADFDEFVNEQWKEQKKQNSDSGDAYWWDEQEEFDKAIRDILDNTDLNEISEDSDLYKAVSIYRHILDTGDYDQRIDSAKEHLQPIENIKSLEDIYKLYQTEEYMMFSQAFKFTVSADYNGYHAVWFEPNSMMGDMDNFKSLFSEDNPNDSAKKEFLSLMEKLGYSEERTIEIFDNASVVGEMIDDYWKAPVTNDIVYFDSATLEKENVSVPVIDILGSLEALGKNKDFIAKDNFSDLLNTLYQEENVEAIRDHMLLGTITRLFTLYGEDVLKVSYGIEYSDQACKAIKTYAPDAINKAYSKQYLGDFDEQRSLDMVEDIKNSYRDIIDNTEWLGTHGKELAKHKILTMRVSLGKNEIENDLSDINLSGNLVDDYISLLVSKERFARGQIKKEDENRQIFNANLFEVNAYFIPAYNALYVSSGVLVNPYCSKTASFEEMLGYYGMLIAHEYAHSYDPTGINYDWRGWWEPWMTEDEESAYTGNQQKITDFFDGLEVEYGRKIDGELIKNETFADLMAMRCCLKILEQKENPDYDLFFRTYAGKNACYITEQDIDRAMEDTHLIGKARVNFILGQFDKFYEVYDIDENSPYYVPKEKRLAVF
ncbi:M13-type metalloendopeptidase [Butyrivibrio sp. LC3010]|uniref:M13-type metalloendopeptidase n=1 Tax=Butyrivibrio sp. LC3010 TaxID=1280680 RepID=UPI0003FBA42E|nr:M13-type metalloendopeptidase [Butyrivibrio sp. LC3010]